MEETLKTPGGDTTSIEKPVTYYDFDGTVVEKLSLRDPRDWKRNATKSDLALVPGFTSFATTLNRYTHNGGVVSKRKDWLRRRVTEKSIRELEVDFVFRGTLASSVRLLGSDLGKASFLVARAMENPNVSIVEDRPDKLVPGLVRAMLEKMREEREGEAPELAVTVGVVDHPKANKRIVDIAEEMMDVLPPSSFEFGPDPGSADYRVEGAGFGVVRIAQLPAYSEAAGREFGEMLLAS